MSGSGPSPPSIKMEKKKERKKEIQALFLTAAGANQNPAEQNGAESPAAQGPGC